MNAYTTFESDGATSTSTRPHGPSGSPFALPSSFTHVAPPSALRKSALALGDSGVGPPERYVQPWRRKSHMPAKRTSGFLGSIVRPEQPVDRLLPRSTSDHVLPPSV